MAVYSDFDAFANAFLGEIEGLKLRNTLGLGALRIIRKRTREGRDVDGNPFAPYSEGYAKRRGGRELPTDTVDLAFSVRDGMMQDLRYDITGTGNVVVGFGREDKAEIAGYHSVTGAGESKIVRNFFGLSDEEEKQLAELAGDDLAQLLLKL